MRTSPLWRQLLVVGTAAARRPEGSRLRFVALLCATAGLVGTLTAVWLGTPMTRPGGGGTISWPVLTTTLVIVEAMAIACWWWGAATAGSGAARWRPKAD